MLDYSVGLALMLCSVVLMVITLWWGWRAVRSTYFTNPAIVNLIFFFASYKVATYYMLPLLLGVGSDFRYLRQEGRDISELGLLYMIEAISWLTWLAGMIVIARIKRRKAGGLSPEWLVGFRENAAKVLLVFLVLGFILYRFVTGAYFFDLDVVFPIYLEVFKSLLSYAGAPAAILLLILGVIRWGGGYIGVGVVGVVTLLATIPTRGALIYGIVFAFVVAYYLARNKKVILGVFGLIGVAVVGTYFIAGGLPHLTLNNQLDHASAFTAGIDEKKRGNRTPLEEVEWRFGAASRMSVAFLDMYERGDGAGFNPIKHSLMGVLPRSINPDKPHPSTVDPADIYSQGMYLIYRETYGYGTYSMVEFSSGGHAYWEFGLIGVLILPFISGLYIATCAFYFQWFGVASIALMMAVFKPFGYVDPKIWVSDIAIQLYQIIAPLLLLLLVSYMALVFKGLVKSFVNGMGGVVVMPRFVVKKSVKSLYR